MQSWPWHQGCKPLELVLHELRQVGSGGSFDISEAGRGVLLHQAVQRGLFRTVAFVVNRRAIRRPCGCCAVACTRGSRGCDLGRSQATQSAAIALWGAYLGVPTSGSPARAIRRAAELTRRADLTLRLSLNYLMYRPEDDAPELIAAGDAALMAAWPKIERLLAA